MSHTETVEQLIEYLQEPVLGELQEQFSDFIESDEKILSLALEKLYSVTKASMYD